MHSCVQVTPTSLVLHYYSQRAGLQWKWVEGVIDEVAKQVFGIQVHVEQLRGRDTGDCDQEVGAGRNHEGTEGSLRGEGGCPHGSAASKGYGELRPLGESREENMPGES